MITCYECEAGFTPGAEHFHCPTCGQYFCSEACQTKHNQRMIDAALADDGEG